MPKTKRNLSNDNIEDVPTCCKRLKIQMTNSWQQLDLLKINPNQNHTPKAPLSLCDLPAEILEQIIGNINIWHHNRIRATSKRMMQISDGFVIHQFRSALAKHNRQNPCSYESAALKAIELATDVYVHSGFQSLFCGCILPMLRSGYRDPFCPDQDKIKNFLLHFYKMVEIAIGSSTSQRSWFLYNLTLLRLLKAFPTSSVLTSRSFPLHWQAVVEIKRSWLGKLSQSKCQNQNSNFQIHLLIILSENLIATISGKAFKRVWEGGSQVYVYGTDVGNGKRVPRTVFTLTFSGPKEISSLLSKYLDDDATQFAWLPEWPKDQFTMDVDIICKEASKWGCTKFQHLRFSPFEEHTLSQEDSSSSSESLD